MRKINSQLQFNASDLVNHLACRHLTSLNQQMAAGQRTMLEVWDPALILLIERGIAHEQAYIRHLEETGHEVAYIDGAGIDEAVTDATLEVQKAGREFVLQGGLLSGRWSGCLGFHPRSST